MHSYGINTTLIQYKSTFLSRCLSESRRKVPDVDERVPQNPKRTLFLSPVAKGKAQYNARLHKSGVHAAASLIYAAHVSCFQSLSLYYLWLNRSGTSLCDANKAQPHFRYFQMSFKFFFLQLI